MADSNYWKEFWNTNNIINKPTAHEKVGRTIKGVPITDDKWQIVLNDLEARISLNSNDEVLDIAAGSGVIAIPFSKKARSVTALDLSEKLLMEMEGINSIQTILADAREIEFKENSFTKIIFYFALQHFSEKETLFLFKKIFSWLKPSGILYVGDIPDTNKKFEFFNNNERRQAYFDSIANDSPIIGYWYDKELMQKLGEFTGFKKSQIINQPSSYINAHYRFDIKLTK